MMIRSALDLPACERCEAPGKCAECVSSILGQFELSSDQSRCLKTTGFVWVVIKQVLLVGTILLTLILIYEQMMSWRKKWNQNENLNLFIKY